MPASDLPARDAAALREPLAAIMREAGALALKTFKGDTLKSWLKAQSSPVSEADIAVDKYLHEHLRPLRPEAAWLSEETEDDLSRTSASAVWIVDPIDGTRAYIGGREDWCVAVALAENGRPVLSALYAPATDELFLAAAGMGATLNGEAMRVALGDTLDRGRIAGPQGALNRLVKSRPNISAQPKVHSLALRFARVAQGRLDAAIASENSHDWDLAAADLLLHEAGGVLTDFTGASLAYNRTEPTHGWLIGTGKARHAAALDAMRVLR